MNPNESLNYKVVDLVKFYNYHTKFISIRVHIIFLRCVVHCLDQTLNFRYEICIDYLSLKMALMKKFELQSCRLVEIYSFRIKFISIGVHINQLYFFKSELPRLEKFSQMNRRKITTVHLPLVHPVAAISFCGSGIYRYANFSVACIFLKIHK